jgi:hypothetical protein
MASPREPLDNYGYTALGSAIKRVWDAKGRAATITDIYELLQTGRLSLEGEYERDLSRLATALEPYTRHGVYASYFEGDANIQFDKDFVVLELEELKSKKDLQSVVMQLIMYRITQEMYRDRSRRKLVIIDESWDLMGSAPAAASSRPAIAAPASMAARSARSPSPSTTTTRTRRPRPPSTMPTGCSCCARKPRTSSAWARRASCLWTNG